ncbi:hypothetical protein BC833DRAFT_575997 [Globomyces pollinis-pini]|nr:hypothetical protein BC833DRAFT_575997 [Globomyces pollinis-pini]
MKSTIIAIGSALLASSCCVIQLILNYVSYTCAGFSVLTPYRIEFTTISIILLTVISLRNGFLKSIPTITISILLMNSPEILHWYNKSEYSLEYLKLSSPPLLKYQTCIKYQYSIKGLKCEGCAQKLKSTIDSVDGVRSSSVDFQSPQYSSLNVMMVDKHDESLLLNSVARLDFSYRMHLENLEKGIRC